MPITTTMMNIIQADAFFIRPVLIRQIPDVKRNKNTDDEEWLEMQQGISNYSNSSYLTQLQTF